MSAANRSEYEAWNGDSGRRWIADPDRRDRVIGSVAEALLHRAQLSTAERVVDIGCGCGATTLAAAEAVGVDGTVLGVDISEPMLSIARQRVAERRATNVSLLQTDAQTHRFEGAGRDIAISRFGTMFFDDPVAAFANIAGHLRPGGRLCLATWQPLAANDWLTIPAAALLRSGSLPDTSGGGPGMFAQSDPAVVTDVLHHAGFVDIDVQARTVPLHLGDDVDEAAAHLADTGVGRAVLDTVPLDQRSAALAAVRDVLAEHRTPEGVHLGGAILLTTATKP